MIRVEHNVLTGQIMEIPLLPDEIKQLQEQQAKAKEISDINESERLAKAVARQAVLDRLGLTEDEARLLLG